MTGIVFSFMCVSAVGLILSLIIHISAVLGIDLGLGNKVFVLHVGIFLVWLPTVLTLIKITKNCKKSDFLDIVTSGCPDWMINMIKGFFIYGVINFILVIFLTENQHANHLKEFNPEMIRVFSGHWMFFYSVAFSLLYSATKSKNVDRKCRNGHKMPLLAQFCKQCGAPVKEMINNKEGI